MGDACQPLHISYRFDGDPDGDKEWRSVYDRKEHTKVDKLVPISKGVHGDFDKVMVEYNTDKIQKNLPGLIQRRVRQAFNLVAGGREAAEVAVDLMRRTFDNVNPKEVCDEYVRYVGFKPKERSMKLWNRFGNDMQNIIADGALTLALLLGKRLVRSEGRPDHQRFECGGRGCSCRNLHQKRLPPILQHRYHRK